MSSLSVQVDAVSPTPLTGNSKSTMNPTLKTKFHNLLTRNCIANFVYFVYATIIIVIDFKSQVEATNSFAMGWNSTGGSDYTGAATLFDSPITAQNPYGYGDDYYTQQVSDPYTIAMKNVNTLFVIAASIYMINALQFFTVWPGLVNQKTGEKYRIWDYVMIPEYLNIVEASLYLYTATQYSSEIITGSGRYLDPVTMLGHKLETGASFIELFATFGWTAVWWWTHQRRQGSGITLDDPEFCALILLVSPSFLFVSYSVLVLIDPTNFFSSPLVNSVRVTSWRPS